MEKEFGLTGLQDDLDECFDGSAFHSACINTDERSPRTRPPIRSRPSSIVTLTPFLVSTSAALNPAIPAPTTQTCGMRPWGRVLRIMLSFNGGDSSPTLEMRLADVAELDFRLLLLTLLLLLMSNDPSRAATCLLRAAA